jgi:hypothetical protein
MWRRGFFFGSAAGGSPYPDFAYTLTLSPYRTLLVGGATWEDTTIGLQPVSSF